MATEETLEEKKSASAEEANEVEEGGDVEMSEKNHEVSDELEEDKGESLEAKGEEIAEEEELSGKEGSKDETETKKEKEVEPVTPNERPTRVRKSVERYSEPSSARVSATKLSIGKGTGTQLRDIPNVAFKLSKRKPDENLQILHALLYNKKAKVHSLKKNIGQFSGFVWIENEEKQREKVKEKFDKCNKEKLIDFCDVLNIPIIKTTNKKEELTVKLLEFLESPHATTENLLADKEQKGIKRKKVTPSKTTPGEASKDIAKKQRQICELSEKKEGIYDEEERDDKSDSEIKGASDNDAGEDMKEASEHEKSEEEEELREEKESAKKSSQKNAKEKSGSKNKSAPVKKDSPSKSEKNKSSVTAKKSASKDDAPSGSVPKSKGSVSKKEKVEKEEPERSVSVKKVKSTKEPSKLPAKKRGSVGDAGKSKKSAKKAKPEPSRGEMHAIVVDILKEVDFNTATLSDILKQLGTHFDMDLIHRKAEVKEIITDMPRVPRLSTASTSDDPYREIVGSSSPQRTEGSDTHSRTSRGVARGTRVESGDGSRLEVPIPTEWNAPIGPHATKFAGELGCSSQADSVLLTSEEMSTRYLGIRSGVIKGIGKRPSQSVASTASSRSERKLQEELVKQRRLVEDQNRRMEEQQSRLEEQQRYISSIHDFMFKLGYTGPRPPPPPPPDGSTGCGLAA